MQPRSWLNLPRWSIYRVNNIAAVLDYAAPIIDQAYGVGASGILQRLTVMWAIHGGLKVNMIAAECDLELDIADFPRCLWPYKRENLRKYTDDRGTLQRDHPL